MACSCMAASPASAGAVLALCDHAVTRGTMMGHMSAVPNSHWATDTSTIMLLRVIWINHLSLQF
jgi:hypothetical protein